MLIKQTLLPAAILVGFGVAAMAVADIGPFSAIRLSSQATHAVSSAAIGQSVPKPTLTIPALQSGADGINVASSLVIKADVRALPETKYDVEIHAKGRSEVLGTFQISASNHDAFIDLSPYENRSPVTVYAQVTNPNFNETSNSIELRVDTEGPILTQARFGNGSEKQVVLQFSEDDLGNGGTFTADVNQPSTPATNFYRIREINGSARGTDKDIDSAVRDGNRITLTLAADLTQGFYEVVVGRGVTDRYGNPAGQMRHGEALIPQVRTFAVIGPSNTGPAVAFPDFTPRTKPSNEAFNPGDRVETRVVRLYYNRDAHRVAQIVNRTIKAFNQPGVNARRFQAEGARSTSDQARASLDRREREGIAASQRLRRLNGDVEAARNDLIQMQQRRDRVLAIQRELSRLAPGSLDGSNTLTNITVNNALVTQATITNASLEDAVGTGGVVNGTVRTFDATSTGNIVTAKLIRGSINSDALISGGTITAGTSPQGTIVSGTIVSARLVSGTIQPASTFNTGQLSDGAGVFAGRIHI